jgi:hypothetical protein
MSGDVAATIEKSTAPRPRSRYLPRTLLSRLGRLRLGTTTPLVVLPIKAVFPRGRDPTATGTAEDVLLSKTLEDLGGGLPAADHLSPRIHLAAVDRSSPSITSSRICGG